MEKLYHLIRVAKIAKALIFFIAVVVLSTLPSYSQEYHTIISTATDQTPDSTVFVNCLDSIAKYVYLDSRKIKPYVALCDKLIAEEAELSNSQRLSYVLQQIYVEYNYNNAIRVFEIIEENKGKLTLPGVSVGLKNQFIYLEGYTLLMLGQIEDAQETFYRLLEIAEEKNDTSLLAQSKGSLGKLFSMQEDYANAEKYYLNVIGLAEGRPYHRVNFYAELIPVYINDNKLGEAEDCIKKALDLVDSLDLVDLKIEFLLHSLKVSLVKGNIEEAHTTYAKAFSIANEMDNENYRNICLKSYAEILKAEKKYAEALALYDGFVASGEKGYGTSSELLNIYKSGSELASKEKEYEKAFLYLEKMNVLEDSLSTAEQKERSQYLKIKFQSEQQEKDNALLTASVLQKQNHNRLLYGLVSLFIIATLFFVFAFMQKRKYSFNLERQVDERTHELVDANQSLTQVNNELQEFTNILSHDLKEPLRSIVSFSDMATKEISKNELKTDAPVLEYLGYINKSGRQLNGLINDVSRYQSAPKLISRKISTIDIEEELLASLNSCPSELHVGDRVFYGKLPSISFYRGVLSIAFLELIKNGIIFNDSDIKKVEIKYKKSTVNHEIYIVDNGFGIDAAYHQRIFGMFKRLNGRDDFEGSGLGLNMVRKVLRTVGGDLDLYTSEVNRGSTFRISLPILGGVKA